jgi:squalene-hopene/tetraprenyl-beta-curcumene cyclase
MALKPKAGNPRRVSVIELFATPPESVRNYHDMSRRGFWAGLFRVVDAILRRVEPRLPAAPRRRAIDQAVRFVMERLNGEDGLGAIYPAMANAVMMFDCLGYAKDHPAVVTARGALEKLMVRKEGRTYCQPCLSPIWDTSLAAHAMLETGDADARASAIEAARWLKDREIRDTVGDWAEQRPGLEPGGWAFQYANAYYPDVDDTAVVAMALDRIGDPGLRPSVERAANWIVGMQSKNGGWGSFDADNTHHYLNYIPFADHGALLDPPTADVTARCVSLLAQIGYKQDHPAMAAGLAFLAREQEADGSWFGRWGTNYIYGTWSVLCAYNAAGIDMKSPDARKAVNWLLARQRPDGGWGENGRTYWDGAPRGEAKTSTASQTSWALLGLMAAGEVRNPAVKRGIKYLLQAQGRDGLWPEKEFTAVGFPRVFYLRYHGYPAFFPLWALARYRGLRQGNADAVIHGM